MEFPAKNHAIMPPLIGPNNLPGIHLILGPCSVETESQLRKTAYQLKEIGPHLSYFRGGIWKPRSKPGSFEGVGDQAIDWMRGIKRDFGFKIITEVARAEHVEKILEAGFDAVWIGARTTVNPFYVQEIANAFEGVDLPVFVKNPVNPDLSLWLGALERVEKSSRGEVYPLHRGFSMNGNGRFRNSPQWQLPISLITKRPELDLICDPSHIAGKRPYIFEIAQKALDLNYKGLMIETHFDPGSALSDSQQQITPSNLITGLSQLKLRPNRKADEQVSPKLKNFRDKIDELDLEIIDLISRRMEVSDQIGQLKEKHGIGILQPERWAYILENALKSGEKLNLSPQFIRELFSAIHDESIDKQTSEVLKSAEK